MKELEYPFDGEYLLKKKKALKKELLESNGQFIEIKIAIICGSTVGDLQNILELFLLSYGIKPLFWQGSFNRYYEEAVFDYHQIRDFQPDLIYIHTSVKNVDEFPEPGEEQKSVDVKLDAVYNRFVQVWESIRTNIQCPIIQNNFELLPYRLMGNADVYHISGELHFINCLNQRFYDYARCNKGYYINDINYQAATFGLEKWHDNSMWYLYKYPFAFDAIPVVSFNIANIIKSIYGKNKKALVLDLDNTLWGGAIGDDGVDKIHLGYETPNGMVFSDFQKYLKKLAGLGISLNICSKNDEAIARTGFLHPASVLNEKDFIIFKANWNNKDQNISDIAKELNILFSSVVFVDDNPVERMLVKQVLPEISVPDIEDPLNYIRAIDKSGFFEITSFSVDDKVRNEYYRENLKREETARKYINYTEYLKDLRMVCKIHKINSDNIERVTQLINKTNQFNLTTIRYNTEDVEKYTALANTITFCANLIDRFGDNGIVSCIMAEVIDDEAVIDLWVMSCRVFKRDLEKAMFDHFVWICKSLGVKSIIGKFYKTKKNILVENLYQQLGFNAVEKDDEQGIWKMDIPADYQQMNNIMEVNINE